MDNSSTRTKRTTKRPPRTLADLQANPPRFFTLVEVATWLGVSKWTAEELVRKNELTSNKIGGHRRVSYENLLAYEKATEKPATAVS